MNELSTNERARLGELEAVIEKGLETFVDVGNALSEVRDAKLYREKYGTFEAYCSEKWHIAKGHAYRLMDAAGVANSIAKGLHLETFPTTESQVRPLTSVPVDSQASVWAAAVETAPEGKITAKHVAEVVTRYKEAGGDLEEAKKCILQVAKGIREEKAQVKRAEVIASLNDIAAQEVKAAAGVYDVVVIDPPWAMERIEMDNRGLDVGFDYPTMSEEELSNLAIPTADDAHVWLWTTHKFLPMALRLLEKWGLKYVCTFVWHKPGGMQVAGLPQYNAEFALYARKGAPKFVDLHDFNVCFNAPRGAHSEKPQAFYDVVRRVTGGRRLDMFNRRTIAGFDTWGNEAK